ncbi:uncharacterized protein LOC128203691 [Mya arenaria]|uniref:uncharacterized protein LOC128203691 n=1 Tax=Mya arenaria TaxID=6604 RepID=UPI0022E21A3F|nr:uncharacterized protein LOC128203691 [Mya arenaria]
MYDVKYDKLTTVFLTSLALSTCAACGNNGKDSSSCWYSLWYIWFVLGLFVVVILVLVVLYVKHRTKERNRQRRRRRSTRTIPIHIVPAGPPSYAEPSHKPPSYNEAMQQTRISSTHNPQLTSAQSQNTQVPGIIPYYNDDYGYQPPPTSMRMVSAISGSPQPLPPSYDVAMMDRGQGHMNMVNEGQRGVLDQSHGHGRPS